MVADDDKTSLLRARFEAHARDSYNFRRSRHGTYQNPQLARDWKWFQVGASVAPMARQQRWLPCSGDLPDIPGGCYVYRPTGEPAAQNQGHVPLRKNFAHPNEAARFEYSLLVAEEAAILCGSHALARYIAQHAPGNYQELRDELAMFRGLVEELLALNRYDPNPGPAPRKQSSTMTVNVPTDLLARAVIAVKESSRG